jgi:hypothetical protein
VSRFTIIAGACTAVLAGLAVVAGTSAQSPGPPSGTLELVQLERDAKFAMVDNPPRRKEGPGDVFTIAGGIRNAEGRLAGRAAGVFTQTDATHAQGSAVFKLADGQIVTTGVLDDLGRNDTSDTLAIVGGTGAYAGARGTAVLTEGDGRTRFDLTFSN